MAYSIVAAAICVLLYNLYLHFSPSRASLRKIPGAHWSSGISSLWILWTRFRREENARLQEVHDKRGPIVRLGPNELSINMVDGGIRTVYGSFEKHAWYRSFWNLG